MRAVWRELEIQMSGTLAQGEIPTICTQLHALWLAMSVLIVSTVRNPWLYMTLHKRIISVTLTFV